MDGRYYVTAGNERKHIIVWRIDYYTREEKWIVNKLLLQAKNYKSHPISILPTDILKHIFSFVF
jgi:hypothetical protein